MTTYSSNEELRTLFNQFDADGSGFISKDEFITLVAQSKLGVEESKVLSFFSQIDTNQDGKLSFEEFQFYFAYHEGEFKEMLDFFGMSTGVVQLWKNLEKLDLEKVQHEIESNVVIKNDALNGIEGLPSSLHVITGLSTNPLVVSALKTELTHQNCVALKFLVEDKETIQTNLTGYIETLKELMGEMGPQAKEIADLVPLEVVTVEDGVMLVVDLDKHPMIGAYIQMFTSGPSMDKAKESNFCLNFEFGTTLDLANYASWTAQDLYEEAFFLRVNSKVISPASMMNMPLCKQIVGSLLADNNYPAVSGIICAMSLSKVNLEISFNPEHKKQMISMLGDLNNTDAVGEKIKTLIGEMVNGMGLADMMAAFSFVGEFINDLKKANMTGFSVIKQVSGISAVVTIKANVYNVLKDAQLFELD